VNLQCKNCGALWDTASTAPMAFFNSPRPSFVALKSPAEILAAGEEITFCPKCPMPRLDEAMKVPTDQDRGRSK
jgi:hypothetical protein